MKEAVAYYRVSTPKQGRSGLGLKAQEHSVSLYTSLNRIKLVKKFVEVQTGKKNQRPVLQEALTYCSTHKTLLLIAQLDRLSRKVAFIATFIDSNIQFVAVDNPHADRWTLLYDAIRAEKEGYLASERTKASLQEAKLRGVKLGTNGKKLSRTNKKKRRTLRKKMRPILQLLAKKGITTLRRIAQELNRRKVPTYRKGCRWHSASVSKLLGRS